MGTLLRLSDKILRKIERERGRERGRERVRERLMTLIGLANEMNKKWTDFTKQLKQPLAFLNQRKHINATRMNPAHG